ncbi:MAG TPA: imidazolonepropionase, partial [Peptostreptococcaceae bacterium]|nr:imidazolonepropionase [Peptostreptococcaceae bacterium]
MKAQLIIKNIGQLATMAGSVPKIGSDMHNIEILKDAYVAIADGKFVDVGTGDYSHLVDNNTMIHDANGLTATPGLVDGHTHIVHGGSRENEFAMKLEGVPYIEILKKGGGILSTVRSTKEASFDELYNKAKKSLDIMLGFGVTTVEGKSGYGLELQTELKQLEVAKKLNNDHPVDLVSTFMGAHAVPGEYKENPKEYIDILINEMMPKVRELCLADFCDVFCEEGVFSV